MANVSVRNWTSVETGSVYKTFNTYIPRLFCYSDWSNWVICFRSVCQRFFNVCWIYLCVNYKFKTKSPWDLLSWFTFSIGIYSSYVHLENQNVHLKNYLCFPSLFVFFASVFVFVFVFVFFFVFIRRSCWAQPGLIGSLHCSQSPPRSSETRVFATTR